jgi:hypothetical protein
MGQNQNDQTNGKKPEWVAVPMEYAPGYIPRFNMADKTTDECIKAIQALLPEDDPNTKLLRSALSLAVISMDPGASRYAREDRAWELYLAVTGTPQFGTLLRNLSFRGLEFMKRGEPAKEKVFVRIEHKHRRLPWPKPGRRAKYEPHVFTDAVEKIVKVARAENGAGLLLN